MVGNDIVDLQYIESPRYQNLRYLDRVCTSAEATAIRRSDNPSKNLCIVWAAKEAGFKIFSKQRDDLHFTPRHFVTNFADRMDQAGKGLRVRFSGLMANIGISSTHQWVHAVATIPGWQAVWWSVREMACSALSTATPEAESLAVRALAAKVLAESGHENLQLRFTGRIPSLNFADGTRAPLDVSLSHHGRFASVALTSITESSSLRQTKDEGSAKTYVPGETCFTCMA